jgi:hypothetical protein
MGFRDEISEGWRDLKNTTKVLAGVVALYTGLYVVQLPIIAGCNHAERLIGAEEKVYSARLVDRGTSHMLQIHGEMAWGEFETSDGQKRKLYDVCDIPSGKFISNIGLGGARVGEEYIVSSLEGPLSHKVLSVRDVNEH